MLALEIGLTSPPLYDRLKGLSREGEVKEGNFFKLCRPRDGDTIWRGGV